MSASVDAMATAIYGSANVDLAQGITAIPLLLLIALLILNELLRAVGGPLARRWMRAISPSIAALSLAFAINLTIRLLGFL